MLGSRPNGWLLLALIAVVVFGAQLLVQRNYTVAAVLITCSAMLMAGGGSTPVETEDLLVARALETALGCAVALVVFLLLSRKTPAAWLPTALAETVDAAATAVDQLTPGAVLSAPGLAARRDLQRRVIRLDDTFQNNLNGFPKQRDTAERVWPVVVATERLAYRVLAEGWRLEGTGAERDPGGRLTRPAEPGPPPSNGLRALAEAIRQVRDPDRIGEVPSFLSRDVGDLRRVLQR